MKKILIFSLIIFSFNAYSQLFEALKREAVKAVGEDSEKLGFSKDEAGKAIKEALSKGTEKVTEVVSKDGGYLNNPEIKIPFPKEADKIKKTLTSIGMKKQVQDVEESINKAAELAAVEAKEIFLEAIKDMTISDAVKIVKGRDNAATEYLTDNTSDDLTAKFKPIIKDALDKVEATRYWELATKQYNKVPFTKKVNTNLVDYTNRKALEGLFLMIAKEEKNIRENPVERTTELLKKVFG